MREINLTSLQTNFNGEEWCQFLHATSKEKNVVIDLFIQAELSWFIGHFPDQAVLPGVVQTNWACLIAQHCFLLQGFSKVTNLKFKSMVFPDTKLQMILDHLPEKQSVVFSLKNEVESFSSGVLHFKSNKP